VGRICAGRRLTLGHSAAECAVLFQDASFSWAAAGAAVVAETHSSAAGGREKDVTFRSSVSWWACDLVLSELCLALPFGSLTAVVGDVGSGSCLPSADAMFGSPVALP
jgi:hypothetical protein